MPVVQIFTGATELLDKGQYDLVVRSVDEYIPAYRRIAAAIAGEEGLRVAVYDRLAGYWLRKMAERYGKECIITEDLTLLRQLSRQWGVTVPEWVREQDLNHPLITGMSISAAPGFTFDDFLLSVFFSPFLARQAFSAQLIGELVRSYNQEQWSESARVPLLNRLLTSRFQQWRENIRLPGESALLRLLEQSPRALIDQMGILRVLAGYPETLGARLLGDEYADLAALNLDTSDFPVRDLRRSNVDDLVRVYLEGLTALPADEGLVRLLDEISGCLTVEFEAFRRILPNVGAGATADLIRRARQIFSPIARNPKVQQGLADLDLLIAQPAPDEPQEDWDEDRWMIWAVNQYLPYRYWLENTGRLDAQIARIADCYARWFFNHYSEIRLNSPKMAWRILPQELERIKRYDAPVLFVVLDNFNTKFLNDLQADMQAEGFFLDSLDYRFSLLPSCTEVCKPSLFAGDSRPPEGSYPQILGAVWPARTGKTVLYLPHIGALRAVTAREHDIYFLNYMPPDLSLHQDEEQTGISHSQAIRAYLAALAVDIRAFAERIGAERDLLVMMTADHGSTVIPADTPNVIDKKFYKDRLTDLHHRYISIKDAELKKLPKDVSGECFVLKRELYELPKNYLVAQQLFRFGRTTESVAVHGGVTPEETIVPYAVFTPVTISPKPLVVVQIDRTIRGGGVLNKLGFEITNTNTYPVEDLSVELIHPGLDFKELNGQTIGRLSAQRLAIEARFKRSHSGETGVKAQLRLRYTFLDQPQEQMVDVSLQVQATMRNTMDDLFK